MTESGHTLPEAMATLNLYPQPEPMTISFWEGSDELLRYKTSAVVQR